MTATKPNVLFIQADQLKPQVLPAYGGAAITPHIDTIVEQGVVFENAQYCNFPLCARNITFFDAGGTNAFEDRCIRQRC